MKVLIELVPSEGCQGKVVPGFCPSLVDDHLYPLYRHIIFPLSISLCPSCLSLQFSFKYEKKSSLLFFLTITFSHILSSNLTPIHPLKPFLKNYASIFFKKVRKRRGLAGTV